MAKAAVRAVLVTLDAHLAGAEGEARASLARDLPGLTLAVHAASDWSDPAALARCRADIATADVLLVTMLFTDEQAEAVADAIAARRDQADAVAILMCAPELTKLTKLGRFHPGGGDDGHGWSPLSLLRKLRGARGDGRSSGERQMSMLRRVPQLLRFIPGTAQDVRAYLLLLQYWLAGSGENIANAFRLLVDRYATGPRKALKGALQVEAPAIYPEVGVYHPSLGGLGIGESVAALPRRAGAARVGLVIGRSYVLARNTAHYDAMIAALEARGLDVVPAFASSLDSRPALERFFAAPGGGATVDAVVNLTGFSLVGGPAYNDSAAAVTALQALDVPYACALTLEFQGIEQWREDPRGLNPLQATLQVAIPELDGATLPMVVAGKGAGERGRGAAAVPIPDRVELLADRLFRWVALRRTPRSERRIAVTLFNFPPNAGNTGTAAYLDVFASLQRTLATLKEAGYTVELPESADALRRSITEGNRQRFGAPANVFTAVPADEHVRHARHLDDLERVWGPAPGKQLTDGRSLFVLGERFGNVFVGVQPAFGWEGDPMRLLFEGGFAPTHAFANYYRWLREEFGAHAVLHFGTHGALEFMPGKQVGLGEGCWPDRLIHDLPDVYLYAANNSAEGTLAKRRGAATLVSYLTPSITNAGLYRGLLELRGTVDRARALPADSGELPALLETMRAQAERLELGAPTDDDARLPAALHAKLVELEQALIPNGLHVVGVPPSVDERADTLAAMARMPRPDLALPSLVDALAPDGSDPSARARAERVAEEAARAVAQAGDVQGGLDVVRRHGAATRAIEPMVQALADVDALLREDRELPALLHALDGGYIAPAPAGDLLRTPAMLPTGRNLYGFDPYRVPSAVAVVEGQRRADQLLRQHVERGNAFPETIAFVLWGIDNMKSEGTPIAQALALLGAVPRFDNVGRLCGARLLPLEQLGRPRVDVVCSVSGIFRDLLPLQVQLLAEAARLAAGADEPEGMNFVRKHALAHMTETGCDLETAALRVFGNQEGAYGANVNLLIEGGAWQDEDELADLFARRKGFAYGADGRSASHPELLKAALSRASLSFQNLDSLEIGALDVDQYVDALGGLHRLLEKERGTATPSYLGDHTGRDGTVRTVAEQVALETRTRTLNPKWYEAQLKSGYEGVRQLNGRVMATLGFSATHGDVPQWVYRDVAQTFVLDPAMRQRLAELNLTAASGMAGRLLEATDRGYWQPDDETLAALREAAAELEDRLEGVGS